MTKLHIISYVFLIAGFIFLFYVFINSPYATRIPYFKKYAYAYQIKRYAKTLPVGSVERMRFEAIAEAIKKVQKEYSFEPPPTAMNGTLGQ
ncbi:MAG: hypothetical protein NT135_00245 [Candidatus Berkelbacteria bacterium]|nr:hypothetical protein [Candidatus Berkelbacteria bacterium]